ncbi:MAG: hypothetical protein JWP69_985 [Flaviaesturariibacter sp.]|nr:hypothetical protein [Flaviaesturariibacter sp.]
MKTEEIKLDDWARMFIGEVPGPFYIELILRAFFIFLLLLISMRFFGKRMAAQVNRIEMIGLFSLAAAIGVPLQSPDRGLLPSVLIAIIVVGVGRLIAAISFKKKKFESLVEDHYSIIVEDGVMQLKKMKVSRLTIELLFAQLRSKSIRHLGEVKRLYFEANGSFSLIKEENPRPGLTVIPPMDKEYLAQQEATNVKVCKVCGKQSPTNNEDDACPNCHKKAWAPAIL